MFHRAVNTEDFPYPQHTAVMCLNYLSFVAWLLYVGGMVDYMMSQIPVGRHAEVTLPARESVWQLIGLSFSAFVPCYDLASFQESTPKRGKQCSCRALLKFSQWLHRDWFAHNLCHRATTPIKAAIHM